MTDVSQINIVLPLFTTRFNPNIISPSLGSTTLVIFSSEEEYLLVLPVTIASASPHATIQEAQITLSFLTSLSQSHSNIPFSLWSFLNKYFTYLSLSDVFFEFTISISKFSL